MRSGAEMNLSWGLLHAGLQTVLDTALDAVVVMDTDGMVIGWNEHAASAVRLDVATKRAASACRDLHHPARVSRRA